MHLCALLPCPRAPRRPNMLLFGSIALYARSQLFYPKGYLPQRRDDPLRRGCTSPDLRLLGSKVKSLKLLRAVGRTSWTWCAEFRILFDNLSSLSKRAYQARRVFAPSMIGVRRRLATVMLILDGAFVRAIH